MRARSHHRAGKAPGLAASGRPWFAPALALAALQFHCGDGGGAAPGDAAVPLDVPPFEAMPATTGPAGRVSVMAQRNAASAIIEFGRLNAIPDRWPLVRVNGRCAVRRVEISGVPQPQQYAGTVTLRGSSGRTFVATPHAPLSHDYSGSIPLGPGERVEVQATGGAVPGFNTSFTIPLPIDLMRPTRIDLNDHPLVVDRTQDLPLSWAAPQAGADERVTVVFTQSRPARNGVAEATYIHCDYAPAWGAGVVPAAALAALEPEGPLAYRPTIEVSLRNHRVLTLGEHTVAVSGEMRAALGHVDFQ